jgi:hypothetical protein
VLKAIINWIPVVACLLCLCAVTASVDRLPDPPAIKPHILSVKALSDRTPLQESAHHAGAIPLSRWWPFAKPWLFFRSIPEGVVPLHQTGLLQDAANVSPPVGELAHIS